MTTSVLKSKLGVAMQRRDRMEALWLEDGSIEAFGAYSDACRSVTRYETLLEEKTC